MRHRSKSARALCAVLSVALMFPLVSYGQPQGPAVPKPAETKSARSRELIAVLDFDIQGGTKAEAVAISEALRSELLKSGRFILVDRSQLDAILNEQALQQTGCTSEECAVKVGRILGIRRLITGNLTKINDSLWQLSAIMVDVETAETLRAETVTHEGRYVDLLKKGVPILAGKLSGVTVAPGPVLGKGQVFISSEPSDAQIVLDGRPLPQRTEALLENVPEGEHTLVLKKDNLAVTRTIKVQPDQLQRLTLILTLAKAQVLVISNPFDAEVIVDGQPVGQTPASLATTVGQHRIGVFKEGYLPYVQEVQVAMEGVTRVEAVLKQGGTLRLKAMSVETNLQIDGSSEALIDSEFLLLARGQHRLTLERRGYVRRDETFAIRPGEVTTIDAALLPVTGRLTLRVSPDNASSRLGGGFAYTVHSMTGSGEAVLPEGPYVLTVTAPRHTTQTVPLDIQADRNTMVTVSLDDEAARRAYEWRSRIHDWRNPALWTAAVFGAVAVVEYQAVQDSNTKQAALSKNVSSATTVQKYNSEVDAVNREKQNGQTAADYSIAAQAVALIALGVAAYAHFTDVGPQPPRPSPPSVHVVALPMDAHGGAIISMRWSW